MNMLTDEEKNHIKLEEILRHEIRHQLRNEADKSRWSRAWTFVNSAVFLWFLSTIVVGTIGLIYASSEKQKENERRVYEQQQAIARDKLLSQRKLDAEISSRLSYFEFVLDLRRDATAYLVLQKPSEAKYPVNVFPEYASRSFQSLLWELQEVVPQNEKGEIEEAYEISRTFSTNYLGSTPLQESSNKKRPSVLETLSREDIIKLNLQRWHKPLDHLLKEYDY